MNEGRRSHKKADFMRTVGLGDQSKQVHLKTRSLDSFIFADFDCYSHAVAASVRHRPLHPQLRRLLLGLVRRVAVAVRGGGGGGLGLLAVLLVLRRRLLLILVVGEGLEVVLQSLQRAGPASQIQF